MHTSCPAVTMGATGLRRLCGSWIWQLRPASERSARRPHFYPHKESAESFPAPQGGVRAAAACASPEQAPQICLGAEVLICDGMEPLEGLHRLCREGTNELLLEMPFYAWPESIWDTLYQLLDLQDIQIILAHAERYPARTLSSWRATVCRCSSMPACLTKPLHRKRYLTWIEGGCVRYLGSDIHMLGSGYQDWEKCARLLEKRVP